LFVDEWLKDQNGTRAYKHAYPNVKKNHTASAAAGRLLKNVAIQNYIDMKWAEKAAQYKVTPDRILEEESRIAFSNVVKLFNENWETRSPADLPEEAQQALASIKRKTTEHGEEWEYKFWDKGRALERVSKHLGMYEKDNRGKEPSFQEVFDTFKQVNPELAEAVKRKLLADLT